MLASFRALAAFGLRTLVISLLVGALAHATAPASPSPSSELRRADRLKTSDPAEFARILDMLGRDSGRLDAHARWYLRYLQGFHAGYLGHYAEATGLLQDVVEHSNDPVLGFRALATQVDILGTGRNYEQAYRQLSVMLDRLPRIQSKTARFQGLGEAAQLLFEAGQYEAARSYADQMLVNLPRGESTCKSRYLNVHARYLAGHLHASDPELLSVVDICVAAGENLTANALRADLARFDMASGQPQRAVQLLMTNIAQVRRDQYPAQISRYDALLGAAYFKLGQFVLARQHASAAVQSSIKDEYTEPLVMAYRTLYDLARQDGDYQAALDWHEKYMAADKGYLNDVSARAIAYQTVKQQVLARKQQVEALNKQNQILQLHQALDRKAVETGRLYIALLLTVLASVALWLYRLKRSQLRFRHLARRDGLTGILNRKHFLEESERALRYVQRAGRNASFVLMDLDHFKAINDDHGHLVGDHVLKRVVAVCEGHLHSTDVLGRLGGEEFGILMPEHDLERAVDRAERLRKSIAALRGNVEPVDVVVSASFGVACTDHVGYELRQLLIAADDALYGAKHAGRNRVSTGARPGSPMA